MKLAETNSSSRIMGPKYSSTLECKWEKRISIFLNLSILGLAIAWGICSNSRLLPKLKGIYRKDYAKHSDFGGDEDNDIDAIVLTHAHVDHCAYIHYVRPDIPIYCSEGTKLIMQGFQDTGSNEDYIIFGENFQIKKGKKGEITRCRGEELKYPRKIVVFEDGEKFKIDSIEVEPILIDHSLPGVCGFIFHTSNGSIGYTADIRFHGRRH